jgi:methionyl-tRNA formyltransferase
VRITLLANRDLPSNLALNHLVKALPQEYPLTLFLSESVGRAQSPPELRMLTFYEQTLPNMLWFPLIDAQHSTGELLTFRGLAKYLETPALPLPDPNSEEGLGTLAKSDPDLMVSIRFGHILKSRAIAIPKRGVLNLHSGKLPEYRGVMATFRAMLNNDAELASTVHWIDSESIDAGPVICHRAVPREPTRCYLANVLSLYESGCLALVGTINALAQNQIPKSAVADGAGNYYSFPGAADLARFEAAGYQWADPEMLTALLARYQPSDQGLFEAPLLPR